MIKKCLVLLIFVSLTLGLSVSVFAQADNFFPNGIGGTSYKGVKLVAVSQTGPQVSGPLDKYREVWEKKTGAKVEVQTFAFGDLFQKIRTAFVSGANPFDLLVYASDWAGDIMGSGYVIEVPKKIQDQMGYKNLIPAYRERILSWGGKIYGLPYDGDAHMMYYRRDLLTDSKYQEDFKAKYGYDMPAPPTTWKQYYDVAEFFNGMTIDGQTIYGAGTAFKPHAQSYWTFLGIAASFAKAPGVPGYFFDPNSNEAGDQQSRIRAGARPLFVARQGWSSRCHELGRRRHPVQLPGWQSRPGHRLGRCRPVGFGPELFGRGRQLGLGHGTRGRPVLG